MTTNPYLNAFAAAAYVALIAFGLNFSSHFAPATPTVLIPIAMLSLLVLSVVVMATCFFYQPIQLFFEGDKKAATTLFIKTIATFALITLCLFAVLLLLSSPTQSVPPIEASGSASPL